MIELGRCPLTKEKMIWCPMSCRPGSLRIHNPRGDLGGQKIKDGEYQAV